MSNVVQLHPKAKRIEHIVRVGHTGHRTLENLHTAGRVPISHAVVQASHVLTQKDLVHSLSESNAEIILDTQSAELATPAGINSKARTLPWAIPDRCSQPSDWSGKSGALLADRIAEFAVNAGVDAILLPTHFLLNASSPWLMVDISFAVALRKSLDQPGGGHIRIDYHLTVPVSLLRNHELVHLIGERLVDAPVGNVWLRVSGYGMRGSPTATKHWIEAAWQLDQFGKSVIADNVGGVCGISLAAFGAAGGVCHGVAEKENFNEAAWRTKPSGGGSVRRIYLPQLDLYLNQNKAEVFLKGHGAKSLAMCKDPACCHGPDDMISRSKAHALIQSHRQIHMLNAVPELKRANYLMGDFLPKIGLGLRKAKKMKLGDPTLTNQLEKMSNRIDLMQHTFDNMFSELGTIPVARPPLTKAQANKNFGHKNA
ncbi:MAG: hypothetical protein ACREVE_08850 [Gammaproteobacteria bacterium]